jgi:hypothetical protein
MKHFEARSRPTGIESDKVNKVFTKSLLTKEQPRV